MLISLEEIKLQIIIYRNFFLSGAAAAATVPLFSVLDDICRAVKQKAKKFNFYDPLSHYKCPKVVQWDVSISLYHLTPIESRFYGLK